MPTKSYMEVLREFSESAKILRETSAVPTMFERDFLRVGEECGLNLVSRDERVADDYNQDVQDAVEEVESLVRSMEDMLDEAQDILQELEKKKGKS